MIEWADAAWMALVAVLAGFALYKILVFLVGRFTKPTAIARIFLDSAARALGASLCL